MGKTSLGDRMKAYEGVERRLLTRKAPLIVRLDGVHFHSYTKGFERPFDESFLWCMRNTMLHLCENIMGAKLGYTQSDEITLLLTDDDTLDTQPWFGKNLQKIVSVSAAMATNFFNKEVAAAIENKTASEGLRHAYEEGRLALFDARAFVLPREEVLNCFEWRQQDCIRNSIQAVGQTFFSHKELNCKTCDDIKEMLLTEKGNNWHNYPLSLQRGACALKIPMVMRANDGKVITRKKWAIDLMIPIFHERPKYVNKWVYHNAKV